MCDAAQHTTPMMHAGIAEVTRPPGRHSLDILVTVALLVLFSLKWWKNIETACKRIPSASSLPSRAMMTCISFLGYGIHLDSFQSQYLWSHWEASLHVSIQKLRAISRTCRFFMEQVLNNLWYYPLGYLQLLHQQNPPTLPCREAIKLWNGSVRQLISVSQILTSDLKNSWNRHFKQALLSKLNLKDQRLSPSGYAFGLCLFQDSSILPGKQFEVFYSEGSLSPRIFVFPNGVCQLFWY